jgi:hypothetical protein
MNNNTHTNEHNVKPKQQCKMTNTRGAKQAKKKTQLLKSQSSNTKIKTN